ncbi:corrinoid protein [Candidatus Hecatella orcuttiae]|uniref:cobalamin B12-binding domain-containing protein n=1 Tax=Candidatus Hecatella orcuttiae TaxID=1935119 RepID=UPI002867C75C|nr:corrinoid protein [Candidatus Hecatella orcuttiae]
MSEVDILERLARSVIEMDEEAAKSTAEEAVKTGIDPLKAIKEGLGKGMAVVGQKFHDCEIFLPQVMLAADATKAGVEVLLFKLTAERRSEAIAGKVVIGTVKGDIHDIGKNIVAVMLSAAGFEVHDLGSDVPSMKFVEEAEKVKADIIAMSSLMTTTRLYQQEVADYLKDMGLRNRYYIIIGGGAITPAWAREIGADGYGRLADDGVEVCKQLLGKRVKPPLPEPMIKE